MRSRRPLRAAPAAALAALALALAPPSAAAERPPRIDARAWIVVDARDGTELAGRGENRSLPVASTTKLMTAYLAIDALEPGDSLKASRYDAAPAESVIGLRAGERMKVRDLLTALLVASANDAAVTLAEGVSGSVDAFVARMNRTAAQLGLDDTSYANPIGLDDPLNYSSARDLAELSLLLREDRRFREIVALPSAELTSGARPRQLVNRNTLLQTDPSVDGIKTGHTLGAGYVLVASAVRDGVPLVSVVLGTASESARATETAELLDFGFGLYRRRQALAAGEEVGSAAVRYEDQGLPLLAARRFRIQAREDQDLRVELDAPAEVEGPVVVGERLGRAEVLLDGERVGVIPVRAGRAVEEPSLLDRIGSLTPVLALLGAGIVLALAAGLVLRRRAGAGRGTRTPEQRMESRRERSRRRGQERVR